MEMRPATEYAEKPWNCTKKLVRVKTELYFHEKDDMWNSRSHSSKKQAEFYLDTRGKPEESKKPAARPATADSRGCASRSRLCRRSLERELLQVASSQRVLVTPGVPLPCELLADRFTDFKNPLHSRAQSSTWDQYNDLPPNRVKLVVTEEVLQRDKAAVDHISKAIEKERAAERHKAEWLASERQRLRTKLQKRHSASLAKEEKSGVIKVKQSFTAPPRPPSARVVMLSKPRQVQEYHAKAGFEGLILIDHPDAAKSVCPSTARLPTARSTRSNSNLFPLSEKLSSCLFERQRSSVPSPPLAFHSRKLADSSASDLLSKAEIEDNMKALDEFNLKLSQCKSAMCAGVHFQEKKAGNREKR